MKHVTLSTHTTKKANEFKAKRKKITQERIIQYKKNFEAYENEIEFERAKSCTCWYAKEYLSSIYFYFRYLYKRRYLSPPVEPYEEPITSEEAGWLAGSEGEEKTEKKLKVIFTDEWTLISGFRNYKGEVDLILVGPYGLIAMEVKNLRGRIHCDGDVWTRDKYDNYGNLVEHDKKITDKGGRSPSQQLNESIQPVIQHLSDCLINIPVTKVIVLPHKKAEIGVIQNKTVDIITELYDLNHDILIKNKDIVLSPNDIDSIVEIITTLHNTPLNQHTNKPRTINKSQAIVKKRHKDTNESQQCDTRLHINEDKVLPHIKSSSKNIDALKTRISELEKENLLLKKMYAEEKLKSKIK